MEAKNKQDLDVANDFVESSEVSGRRAASEYEIDLQRLRLKKLELEIERERIGVKLGEAELQSSSRSRAGTLIPKLGNVGIATIGLLGVVLGAMLQGRNSSRLEEQRFHSEVVLTGLQLGDREAVAGYFEFLAATRFFNDEKLESALRDIAENPWNIPLTSPRQAQAEILSIRRRTSSNKASWEAVDFGATVPPGLGQEAAALAGRLLGVADSYLDPGLQMEKYFLITTNFIIAADAGLESKVALGYASAAIEAGNKSLGLARKVRESVVADVYDRYNVELSDWVMEYSYEDRVNVLLAIANVIAAESGNPSAKDQAVSALKRVNPVFLDEFGIDENEFLGDLVEKNFLFDQPSPPTSTEDSGSS